MSTGATSDLSPDPQQVQVRDPLAEAARLVGERYLPTVLEPSPPAERTPPYFASDPLGEAHKPHSSGDTPVLTPEGLGVGVSWDSWVGEHPEHSDWAARRWLTSDRRLVAAPSALDDTRRSLHRLAAYVIAPTRYAQDQKFGLRWTLDGFGTPFFAAPAGSPDRAPTFGTDRQVRVQGELLVDQRGAEVRSTRITTLRAAAEFLETQIDAETAAEPDTPPLGDPDETLTIDVTATAFLSSWFAMATAALEALRLDTDSVDPSRPQIWPGHFDPAIEVGEVDRRATYGASPGDDALNEPYLYVSLWQPDRLGTEPHDGFWNAKGFTGRSLGLSEFPADVDPVEVAVNFFCEVRNRL